MAIGTTERRVRGRRPARSARIASVAAVLLLHLGVAMLFLSLTLPQGKAPDFVFTLITPQPPQPTAPVPPPSAEAPGEAPRLADVPPLPDVPAPPSPIWTGPPAQPQPDLAGIGRSLFGCRIENLAALSPEQRAKCSRAGFGVPPDEASLAAVAQLMARENLAFERALAQKQGALLLPCTSSAGRPIEIVGGSPAVGITLFSIGGGSGGTVGCLADGLINGFDTEDQGVYQRWADEPR
jgi:hypothetical protein